MERLTAEDQIMLWPDALWPQQIGAIAILDGGELLDGDGRLRLAGVRTMIEARLHRVPRLRQLLRTPGRGMGGPLWVDAPDFDLDQHLHVVPLADPADEAALLLAVERLRRERLDRNRPLWQMFLLPGLPENRVGLFVTMHHAIADGVAGIATIGTFLDTVPDVPVEPGPPWRPQPAPTRRELSSDAVRRRLRGVGRGLVALAHPARAIRTVSAAWPAARELLATKPAPATSLNRVIGNDRSLALVRTRLSVVKQIAHSQQATVNDVLLTVITGGVRGLLRHRGEPIVDGTVRVDVPVTLRAVQERADARGNMIGQIMVPLPAGVADPVQRLARIAADTAARKATSHPSVGVVLRSRIVRKAVLKLLNRQPVNVTSADLIGPPVPVYLAGARILEVFPVLPLMANVSLGIGALSYAGQFNIAVIADRDAYPDLEVFTTGASDELAALAEATRVRVPSGL
jgi:diacylglycerol O-acyltransferase / wax synthase